MSTLAYGHAYDISMDEIDSWHRFIPSPDLYLYLYVSAGVALRRILARCEKTGQRVEYFEKLNSLMKITSSYEDVYRSGLIKNANRVNGNNKPDKVAKHLQEHVTKLLGLDK
jgi:thymidylate kinase